MFRILTTLPISRRLLVAAALIAIVPGIVIAILGGSYIGTLININETVKTSNDAVKLATDMQADLLRMNALLAGLNATDINAPTQTVQLQHEIADLTNDFKQKLSTYQQNYQINTSPTMKSVHDVLQNNVLGNQSSVSQHTTLFIVNLQWNNYVQAQNITLHDIQHTTSATTFTVDQTQANGLYLPLKGNLDNLVGLTESISQVVAQVNTNQINPILFGTIFAFLFSTLVVFLISYVINLTITNPLRQLVSLTQRISQGETNVRANISSRDEIYTVATSMNTMLDSIARLMQDVEGQRDFLQARADKLISEVSGIGEGDLRRQAEVTNDTVGFLASSFNFMIRELSNLIIRVKHVTQQVETLTSTTQSRMIELVKINDHQIQEMMNAVTSTQQMADSTRKVTERAQTLYHFALETRQTAYNGRGAVQQAVTGMQHIYDNVQTTAGKVQLLRDNSREINNIVSVISSIAHHTNRLALDATIQAATAGANGTGFAAVASDIRRLAEQTKDQAGMITSLVRTVNENISNVAASVHDTEQETAQGTELAQQAGKALGSIFEGVEWQAQAIESITTMVSQQSVLSKEVLQILQEVADETNRNSDNSRDASQTMWRLMQLVEQLRTSVGAFKLREEQMPPIRQVSPRPSILSTPLPDVAGRGRSRPLQAPPKTW
jgi:methyl-accepting chemotaxis protein